MPASVQLGPFLMDGTVLTYVLATLIAYAAIALRLRKENLYPHRFQEVLFNGVMITVLLWKFGVVLTQPMMVMESPASLIMMTGSSRELGIGVLVAAGYVIWQMRKMKLPWRLAADWTAYGLIVFLVSLQLLNVRYGSPTSMPWGISPKGIGVRYHPVGIYTALLLFVFLVWLWRKNIQSGTGRTAAMTLIAIGVSYFAVSLLKPQGDIFLILSYEQWACLGLIALGYVWASRGIISEERSDVNESK